MRGGKRKVILSSIKNTYGSTYWFHLKVTLKEAKKKEAEAFKLHGYLCL